MACTKKIGMLIVIVVLTVVVAALVLIIGLAVGFTRTSTTPITTATKLTTTTSTTTTLTTTTSPAITTTAVSKCPSGVTGWCEWSTWSSCTHSCGHGGKSRLRSCSNDQGDIERRSNVIQCEGKAVQMTPCNEGQCQTGLKLVTETARKLRERLNLEDNLFLDRYAQSVTDNGEIVNVNSTGEIGYGIWRLTEKEFDQILPNENTDNSRLIHLRTALRDTCSWKRQFEKTISWEVRYEVGKFATKLQSSGFFQLSFPTTRFPTLLVTDSTVFVIKTSI